MTEPLVVGCASIIVLGISAQWLAWRLHLPSILLLLLFGFTAGPLSGFLQPEKFLGDLLFPLVSLSVAIILFEGGLSLRFVELPEIGRVVRRLITVGALTTWGLITLGAVTILHLNWTLAVLLGAMLVVSGPTVVGPLLRTVRPIGRLASTLKWEGILIDPIGVLFSVLVFEVILEQEIAAASLAILGGVLKMAGIGSLLGWLSARLLVTMFQRYWVPDFLHNAVALAMVIGVFTLANTLHEESGLFAVTVMGIVMANQKAVTIRHIVAFKEVLQGLLIATLFMLLAARLRLSDLAHLDLMSLLFLALLIVVVRPLAVVLSTRGSDWSWRERAFLAWVAPRGIVAAAVAPIFAHRLGEVGVAQVELLVPLTFLVIAGTVAIYGLTASHVARWLGIAQANPQGIVCMGASPLARAFARAVHAEGFRVLLVDTNWPRIAAARLEGLPAYYGNALLEETLDDLDLDGIGRLLALTPNDEANALAALHFADIFGRAEVYQLSPGAGDDEQVLFFAPHLHGRFLFAPEMSYARLNTLVATGATIKATRLSEQFTYLDYQQGYDNAAVPLFVVREDGSLQVVSAENDLTPAAGQRLLSLIPAGAEQGPEAAATVPAGGDKE